jgi:hypothetical protein
VKFEGIAAIENQERRIKRKRGSTLPVRPRGNLEEKNRSKKLAVVPKSDRDSHDHSSLLSESNSESDDSKPSPVLIQVKKQTENSQASRREESKV